MGFRFQPGAEAGKVGGVLIIEPRHACLLDLASRPQRSFHLLV
jgi:hypothetical protein